jgi:GNAT superfamily N-acetyltransferase
VGDVSEYSALANHNFVGSYRKLVQHVAGAAERAGPHVYSFTTGMPFGLFNGTIVTGPTDPATLTAHLEWLSQRGVPYRCWIDEGQSPGLDGEVRRHGLDRDPQPYPAMLMAPLERAPLAAAGVEVHRCTDAAGYDAHIASHVANGVPAELAPALILSSMARDPEVALFTGWVDGELVGQSIAIRTGATVGVYAVGVIPDARRRGVGTALTWAGVDAGREWGCRAATLQASAMGLPIYERMGFGMVVPYAQYRQPPTSACA